ncbi:hypothetical protein KIW84_034452 [Lathyrus oleraceus]|uniref:DNA 5'-3' helicase n=1 Tax=Pisum sativum TaxID=3888 RepID=A0A9D4Y0Z5_PEA|nr:hypothetical protein KIW84_034452 [Pisum sativum]
MLSRSWCGPGNEGDEDSFLSVVGKNFFSAIAWHLQAFLDDALRFALLGLPPMVHYNLCLTLLEWLARSPEVFFMTEMLPHYRVVYTLLDLFLQVVTVTLWSQWARTQHHSFASSSAVLDPGGWPLASLVHPHSYVGRLRAEYNRLVEGLALRGDLLGRLGTENVEKDNHVSFVSSILNQAGIDQKTMKFCYDRLHSLMMTLEITDTNEFLHVQTICDFATLVGTYARG